MSSHIAGGTPVKYTDVRQSVQTVPAAGTLTLWTYRAAPGNTTKFVGLGWYPSSTSALGKLTWTIRRNGIPVAPFVNARIQMSGLGGVSGTWTIFTVEPDSYWEFIVANSDTVGWECTGVGVFEVG